MGIPTLLRNVLGIHHPDSPADKVLKVNIYGPAGLRSMLRTIFALTHTRTAEAYAVHELLSPGDPITPCEPPHIRHSSEAPGRDIMCDDDGFWRNIASGHSPRGEVIVQAGPILHRDPCIGYIFHEPPNGPPFPEPRKIVVLGDTSSATDLTPLISSTPGRISLLVHESTDAWIPPNIDTSLAARRSPELVKQKCLEHGHSTPLQAGQCAGQWDAERLVLNHIGSRFPAPSFAEPRSKKYRTAIMREIERQATEAWNTTPSVLPPRVEEGQIQQRQAIAASDFMSVHIPVHGTGPPSEYNGRRGDNPKRGSNWDKRRRMNT
ncbi:hypothetical protein EVG20_g5386 [Dentipellis fragilis]|uniref:Metallo-beta-lactamase domain-containing protein n=1 Tax=Dentipellis fragilis TaxID=205917 RepID=A0A4Y9YVL1_9AGAM|nr:hypothetical protein EVG20_g5386 [Dentipellis fragilis]